MNENNFWAHIHLAVNEVPIIGFLFATIFLSVALTSQKQDNWARAGMLTLGISILGLLLAFFSGDPALDVISGQPRTSGRALTLHHIRSVYATALGVVTAVIAVVTVVKARKADGAYSRRLLKVVLIATIITTGALVWTGLAGGKINHPELQGPADRESGPAHEH